MVEQVLAEKYLDHFIRQAWHVVEPAELKWDWHMDAICEHLMAVTSGQIKDLIICVPPRHTKSLIVSVFWPMWEWIEYPSRKWLFTSYAQELSTRDSRSCRKLIKSDWYQSRWADKFHLVDDQDQKTRFENNKRGYRLATSIHGLGTGEGGDRIVVDDPHNIQDVESDAKRGDVIFNWDEVLPSRINDELTGARVVIMQRSRVNDLAGHILDLDIDLKWSRIILPARYEGPENDRNHTALGFKDPRKEIGEILAPNRMPLEAVNDRESRMSAFAVACQQQQRPYVRGGGLIKVDKIELLDEKDFNKANIVETIRYWDKAGTEDGGKRTSGIKMHRMRSGKFLIAHVVKGQWGAGKRNQKIKDTAKIDAKMHGINMPVWIEQEPGSGGKESAEISVQDLAGFNIHVDKVTTDKFFARPEGFIAQVDNGNVQVLIADWTQDYIDELEVFGPGADFVDQVDATVGAFNKMTLGGEEDWTF